MYKYVIAFLITSSLIACAPSKLEKTYATRNYCAYNASIVATLVDFRNKHYRMEDAVDQTFYLISKERQRSDAQRKQDWKLTQDRAMVVYRFTEFDRASFHAFEYNACVLSLSHQKNIADLDFQKIKQDILSCQDRFRQQEFPQKQCVKRSMYFHAGIAEDSD